MGYDGAMRYRLIRPDRAGDRRPRRRRGRRRRTGVLRAIAVLPTVCTLGNLLCGFLAVFFASRPSDTRMQWDWTPLTFAGVFIFVGMIFDALDGLVARLTHQSSQLGEQLDSMADMVTFGVAPAFLAVQLVGVGAPFASLTNDFLADRITLVVAAIYVACVALRLARFNVEAGPGQHGGHAYFSGMPSPAAAGTVASLILLHQHFLADYWRRQLLVPDPSTAEGIPWSIRLSAGAMVGIMLIVALAMVSRLKYVHVMNRYVRGRAPFGTFVKVIIIMLLLTVAPQQAIAVAFVIYALSAPVTWGWRQCVRTRGAARVPRGTHVSGPEDPGEPKEHRSAG